MKGGSIPKYECQNCGTLRVYRIEYTKEEVATWDEVYARVFELLPGRASAMHRKYLAIMEAECGYGLGQIPQLEDVSNFLKRRAIG